MMAIFCTSGFATNLTRENAYLVHATNHFPVNGNMVPGCISKPPTGIKIDDATAFAIAQRSIPQLRNTLHWCSNSFPYPHQLQLDQEMNRDQYRYVIIEPWTKFDFIASGYWQDVVTIGVHTLSNRSAIFVHESDQSVREKIGVFQGEIIPYSGRVNEVVSAWLESKNAPVFFHTAPCNTLNLTPYLKPCSMVEERYEGHATVLPSEEISRAMGLDNTLFTSTLLGKLQHNSFDILEYIRDFRMYYELRRVENADSFLQIYNAINKKRLIQSSMMRTFEEELAILVNYYSSNHPPQVAENIRIWRDIVMLWVNRIFTEQIGITHTQTSLVALMDSTQTMVDTNEYRQYVPHQSQPSHTVLSESANRDSCKICGKTTELKKCARCQKIFYCSRECQKKDWPNHKAECHL